MPQHNFERPKGKLSLVEIDSEALAGNLLGDPTRRSIVVYLPPGYDESNATYPLLVGLESFSGSGLKQLGWKLFGESLPQRIDRLVSLGKMGPTIAAFPDCFTSLGGNQYINSPVFGRWEDFLLDEMLPLLEKKFRIQKEPERRAVFGFSSGGYGALIEGLLHGHRWGAIACHSGDIGFDLVYRVDFPKVLDVLARHDGNIKAFLQHFRESKKDRGGDLHALMLLAMGAAYDPDPNAHKGIRLPIDLETCELDQERWAQWTRYDPLVLIKRPECQNNLRHLKQVYLDCGKKDQYHLHYGARSFVKSLEKLSIPYYYEEFDDNHSRVDYRFDVSLPILYRAISAD